MRAGPLAGVRVLEIGHMLAGPYCGMLLADLGADVVKIESGEGDLGRRVGPHFVGPHNAYFASLNRNKRGVWLDLTDERDRACFEDLVRDAQALVTNLRPRAIRKLGLTHAQLASVNPRIVCVAITGYGLDGPYADQPAYDYVIQALAGVMALTGDPDGPPVKLGYSAVDNSTGILAALGLVAMVHEGVGGQIDIALYDTMLSQLNYLASAYLNAGERPRRRANGAHPYIVPAQVFPARTGFLALFVSHDRFWRAFANEIGRPEWGDDPRFATMEARARHRDSVVREIETVLATDDAERWVERLAPHGIVVAAAQDLAAALDGPLTESRGLVVTVPTPDGPLRLVGNPIRIDGVETSYAPPPRVPLPARVRG